MLNDTPSRPTSFFKRIHNKLFRFRFPYLQYHQTFEETKKELVTSVVSQYIIEVFLFQKQNTLFYFSDF